MRLYIARRPQRQGVVLKMQGTRAQPMQIIPLGKRLESSELDELLQSRLEKLGVPKERWHDVIELAESESEERLKVRGAITELKMRVEEQARYPKLRWGGLKPPRKRSQAR